MQDHGAKTRFQIDLLPESKRKAPLRETDDVPFGRVPTNHMLVCDFLPDKGGWQTPTVSAYKPFELNPGALVFHYGQTIFEGMKAYRSSIHSSSVYLFRPEMNAKRMRRSAEILGMEAPPESLFLDCVRELVRIESDWIVPSPGSLYVRPAIIPLDEGVSYRGSSAFRFFIILSPAKNYFGKENAVSVYIERERVRAVRGGVGEAKCGGNYAAALPSLTKARNLGAEQVLWLDGVEQKYVEEVGAMNVMFVYGNKIVTPSLSGSILPGITRDSIIHLARHKGFEVLEERVSVDDVILDIQRGNLTEMFGCGTAAVVTPVGELVSDKGRVVIGGGEVGEVSRTLKNTLVDIQTGSGDDPFGWRFQV